MKRKQLGLTAHSGSLCGQLTNALLLQQNHRCAILEKRFFWGGKGIYASIVRIEFVEKMHDFCLIGPSLLGNILVVFQKDLNINHRHHIKVLGLVGPQPLVVIGHLH